MKSSQGFTLIEVLVVIVVIALLVSISAINSDSDPRENTMKNESTRVKFFLESFTDEAILNSKNIAIYLTHSGATPYEWKKIELENNTSSQDTEEKWGWAPYKSNRIVNFQLQNEIIFKLSINENDVPLKTKPEEDKEITPQIIIQSSGIQTLANINLSIDDYDKTITIKGNGAGRYKIGGLSDEIQ